MRYVTFFILIFLASSNLYAQNSVDNRQKLRTEISKELSLKGVNNFFFFIKTTPSRVEEVDENGNHANSYFEFMGYAFWRENSNTYIKKFNYRGISDTEELRDFTGIDFATQHLNEIKLELTLPYTIFSEGKKTELYSPIDLEYNFYFHINSIEFEKQFRRDELDKNDSNNVEFENINYDYNHSLKIIQLYKIILAALHISY